MDSGNFVTALHERPEIGSVELKGFFGTGVVITRTNQSAGPGPSLPHPPVAAQAAEELEQAEEGTRAGERGNQRGIVHAVGQYVSLRGR